MTKVILPRLNQTGANEWADVQANDEAIATVVNGELSNENIVAGANIARSKLEGGAQGIAGTLYTPTVIATEESRTNVAFGTLTTPDEISGVVVPTNGILFVGYLAAVKSSVASAGSIALFIGSNQATESSGSLSTTSTEGTGFSAFQTYSGPAKGGAEQGLGRFGAASFNTTSMLGAGMAEFVGLAAGTYAISVKFKASSGSITAKQRRLTCFVLGT